MTKTEALHQFFSGFGLPAYPVTAIPADTGDRYLTYELRVGCIDDGELSITVNLWFYTKSEAEPNAMAQQLSTALGQGGKTLPCDGGYIWLKRGSPWCQNLSDGDWKRRYINVSAEFLTAD